MSVLTMLALILAVTAAVITVRVAMTERRRTDARVTALAAAMDGPATRRAAGSVEASDLFRPGRVAPDARPLQLAFGLGIAAVTGVALLAMSLAAGSGGEAAAAAPPLELLSMSHDRTGTALVVTGRVRRTGAGVPSAEAEVLAYDADGRQVGSGRAPLAFGSGGESAFRITMPEAPGAARYRVGFRSGADALRHIDRR